MTDEAMTRLFVVLDQVWGSLDEGREAGYRFVLDDFDDEVVGEAVRQMAQEDRPWLPKAPEIAARCHSIVRKRRNERRMRHLLDLVGERLALSSGDPDTVRAVVRRDLGKEPR